MDRRISVDVNLIPSITGLPFVGVNPVRFFSRHEQDLVLITQMKEKYDLNRYKRGLFIASINDTAIWLAKKLLSSKLLKKMRLNQCTARTITAAEQCVVGF